MVGETAVTSAALIVGVIFAALAASGTDSRISSYAIDNTPVFGSAANAKKASDAFALLSAGTAALIYAVKYFPLHDRPADPPYRHIRAGENSPAPIYLSPTEAFEAAALSGIVALPTADQMKKFVVRPRPNGEDDRSFPSGHATFSAWINTYSAQMLNTMHLPAVCDYPARGALTLFTAGTAWGRVEGAKHYPSDVLAGILLGICLTDAAFAFMRDNAEETGGARFNIAFTNDRDVMTTTLTTTVDF